MPTLPKSLVPKRERKSRRTHKNSRDGCPNCRSKRIKCPEDLPSCQNCVKKDIRCGYLDFPPDKLEIIRKKNDVKRSRLGDSDVSVSVASLNLPPVKLKHESDTSASESSSKTEISPHNHHSLPHPHKRRSSIKIRQSRPDTESASAKIASLRSQVYLKAFLIVTNKEEPVNMPVISPFKLWNEGSDFTFSWENNVATGGRNPATTDELFYGTSEYMENMFKTPEIEIFLPLVSGQNLDYTPKNGFSHPPPTVVSTESSPVDSSSHPPVDKPQARQIRLLHVPNTLHRVLASKSRLLPNAIVKNTSFPVLEKPESLKNKWLERNMRKFKGGKIDLKSVFNDDFPAVMAPVYSERELINFWICVFHQAAMLNLYYTYFIDKSVNILIRASDTVVNGDIDFVSLPSTFLGTSSPDDASEKHSQLSFFYNKSDLDKLVRKSYVTYGRVIRELRESINRYHHEYPAKMSLYTAWACYINAYADINTFSLMLSGTFMLIQNVLDEARLLKDISPAILQEIRMINSFAMAARYPDYKFDIVIDLAESFQSYKKIANSFFNSYERGENFDEDLVRVIKDPLFRHDFHELDKFFTRLMDYYRVKFKEINKHYKAVYNHSGDLNLRFVSPTLLFELIFEWFRIFPGDKMSLNSQNNPLKKTLYYFYHALAKCVAHVCSPAKSVLFVDMCNIMMTKVGMPLSDFDPYNRPLYASIEPTVMNLVKVIKFFENRLRLYGYYLASENVLGDQYVTSVRVPPPADWSYRDIVHLGSPKVSVDEVQLGSLRHNVITAENIAFFPEILKDPTSAMLIQQERNRQVYAINNLPWQFNYSTGMLNHDFDATKIIDHFIEVRHGELLASSGPSLEELRAQNSVLINSRRIVDDAFNVSAGN